MSTPEETSAVEGVDNGKQGNTQTQGESNTCQTSVQRETERNRLPEKQSTDDQGNGTVSHVEMWKVRQDRTPDERRQEGTREIVQHIRMWEGRYTPRDSKQEFNMDQQITNQDEMQRERATPTEVDQRNQEDTGVIREHVRM